VLRNDVLTPVNSINAFSEQLLAMPHNSDERRMAELFSDIQAQSDRLQTLVRDIVGVGDAFSFHVASHHGLRPSRINPESLVHEVMDDFRSSMQHAEIQEAQRS
jgi:signal transduction histidine kinase